MPEGSQVWFSSIRAILVIITWSLMALATFPSTTDTQSVTTIDHYERDSDSFAILAEVGE